VPVACRSAARALDPSKPEAGLEALDDDINDTTKSIRKVEAMINELLDSNVAGSQEELAALRREKEQLRREKEQLRRKKELLLMVKLQGLSVLHLWLIKLRCLRAIVPHTLPGVDAWTYVIYNSMNSMLFYIIDFVLRQLDCCSANLEVATTLSTLLWPRL